MPLFGGKKKTGHRRFSGLFIELRVVTRCCTRTADSCETCLPFMLRIAFCLRAG